MLLWSPIVGICDAESARCVEMRRSFDPAACRSPKVSVRREDGRQRPVNVWKNGNLESTPTCVQFAAICIVTVPTELYELGKVDCHFCFVFRPRVHVRVPPCVGVVVTVGRRVVTTMEAMRRYR